MPRGGKRKGAGRKAGWNLGKTKAVKLAIQQQTDRKQRCAYN